MADSQSEGERKFEELLQKVKELNFQDEAEADVFQTVKEALRKHYDNPPTKQMEQVMFKNMVDDEVRQILFYPSSEDIELYPLMICSPPEGAPKEHPQFKVQICAMPLLYLRHVKEWELAKGFIEAGGLDALTQMFDGDNLYLRSQAIETFSKLSDQMEFFDWTDAGDKQGNLRLRLFHLNQKALIEGCLINMKDSYPQGGFTCLRILAFYLSWLRALYTKNRVLYVSQKVLDSLQEWQKVPGATEHEKELAKVLYDDFSRWPSAEERRKQEAAGGAASNEDAGAKDSEADHFSGVEWNDEPSLNKIEEIAEEEQQEPVPKVKTASELKEEGNTLLKSSDHAGAERKYTEALPLATEEESKAILLNRALARLSIAGSGALQGAIEDCTAALKIDKKQSKAFYRRGSACLKLKRYEEAVADLQKALDLRPDDAAIKKVLEESKEALSKAKASAAAAEKARKAQDVDELD